MLLQPSSLPALADYGSPAMPSAPSRSTVSDGSTGASFAAELDRQIRSLPPLPGSPRTGAATGMNEPVLRELEAGEQAQIRETAQQLESLLLYQLLKQMWASIPESGLLPAGNAGKIYREMWLEQIADQTSSTGGGIGIAHMVEQQLSDQARRTFTPEQAAALR